MFKLLCLSLLIATQVSGCTPNKEVAQASAIPNREIKRVESFDEILFNEVPDSDAAAKDFLSVIEEYNLTVKGITVTDYGYGNYLLDCTFTDTDYSIVIYVKPDGDYVKWYGSLKHNDSEVKLWRCTLQGGTLVNA